MLLSDQYRQRDPFALMRSALYGFDRPSSAASSPPVFPAVNVWGGDDAIAVTAEIPGVETSDIDITLNANVLTLSGERTLPDMPDGATWHRRERGIGAFSRAIRLPFEADESKVEARFQDGVLRIVVGRPEEAKPRKIEVTTV